MEQSTKTILWIVAFITLPLTIPLAIISIGIVFTALCLVLGLIVAYPIHIGIIVAVLVILFGLNSWFPPTDNKKVKR